MGADNDVYAADLVFAVVRRVMMLGTWLACGVPKRGIVSKMARENPAGLTLRDNIGRGLWTRHR